MKNKKPPLKSTLNKPIALSFFSGAMGLDLGIEAAGFEVVLACESDKYCQETIKRNRPDIPLIGDILKCSKKDVLDKIKLRKGQQIDLIMGGPPCQAFSTAGKRGGFSDARGNVFLKYIELATELKPKFIVIENVRGLLSCPLKHVPHDERIAGNESTPETLPGSALNFVLKRITDAGYKFSFNLYNAANFGSPQSRERVVIICSLTRNKLPHLTPTHSEGGKFGLPTWRTFKDATQGMMTREQSFVLFPEKRLKYYRMLTEGQYWKNLPHNLQKEALGNSFYSGGGKTGFLRRLAWNKPSPTLVTNPAMPATDLCHPEEDRPLSIEEYKRIQEFPDSWGVAGSIVEQYRQLGNAVPISLGKAVGTHILTALSGTTSTPALISFPYSRYKNTDEISWQNEFNSRAKQQKQLVQDNQLAIKFV